MPRQGVLYIATGRRYVEKARRSAASIKALRPDLPIAICTEVSEPGQPFDSWLPIESPAHAVRDKCENMQRSPFDRTIYLDADTYVCDDSFLQHSFEVLDSFDLAATLDVGRRQGLKFGESPAGVPEGRAPAAFPWLNTGFIAFRDATSVADLFDEWRATHERHRRAAASGDATAEVPHVMEQPAFREALYRSTVRYATLPMEFNCRIAYGHYLLGEVAMIHGWITNYEEVASQLNRRTDPRAFRTVIVHDEADVTQIGLKRTGISRRAGLLWASLRRYGIRDTVRSLVRWARGGSFNRRTASVGEGDSREGLTRGD